jgi:hypothetical protein
MSDLFSGIGFFLLIFSWPVILLGPVVLVIECIDRKRYSLRTIFIATTVLALVLGVGVCSMKVLQ